MGTKLDAAEDSKLAPSPPVRTRPPPPTWLPRAFLALPIPHWRACALALGYPPRESGRSAAW